VSREIRAAAGRAAASGGAVSGAIASAAAARGATASAATGGGGGAIHFEIGRITLHGFPPAYRARFLASLQASLTELGTGGDWSPRATPRLGRLLAGPLRAGASPEDAAGLVVGQIRAAIASAPNREPAR
jgi:hypothetical protein